MVVTVLKEKLKTVVQEVNTPEGVQKIHVEKVVGHVRCKMETDDVSLFMEDCNKKYVLYKKRCLLRTVDGWIVVNHSFDDLQKMKSILHKKVEIKGYAK